MTTALVAPGEQKIRQEITVSPFGKFLSNRIPQLKHRGSNELHSYLYIAVPGQRRWKLVDHFFPRWVKVAYLYQQWQDDIPQRLVVTVYVHDGDGFEALKNEIFKLAAEYTANYNSRVPNWINLEVTEHFVLK